MFAAIRLASSGVSALAASAFLRFYRDIGQRLARVVQDLETAFFALNRSGCGEATGHFLGTQTGARRFAINTGYPFPKWPVDHPQVLTGDRPNPRKAGFPF